MNYRPDPFTRTIARAGRAIMSLPAPLLCLAAGPPRAVHLGGDEGFRQIAHETPRPTYLDLMNRRPAPFTRTTARAGRAIMSLPAPLLRLAARPPRNGRGYLLDPDVARALALLKVIGSGKGIGTLPAAKA